MRGDRGRLLDILESIGRIERYASRRSGAVEDELILTWIVHHLEIVGEAGRQLSAEVRARHPEVPWSGVIGMRNTLVHEYFSINVERVRRTLQHDLPALKTQIGSILEELTEE